MLDIVIVQRETEIRNGVKTKQLGLDFCQKLRIKIKND